MDKRKQLLIALVIGGLALLGNKTYLDARVRELSPKEYVSVVRAKSTLNAGTTLDEKLFEQARIPRNFLPKASITWNERGTLIGEQLAVTVLKGDYILDSYFAVTGSAGRTLSEQLDGENSRAISLPVDDVNSLARSVVAGDRIDIALTFTMPVINQKVSTTLLQNVLVLATGQYSQVDSELGHRGGRADRYSSLTLKLSMEEAMRLNYARQVGKVSVLLRSPTDNGVAQVAPIGSIADLLSPSDKEAIAAIAARVKSQGGDEADERMKQQIATLLELQKRQSAAAQ